MGELREGLGGARLELVEFSSPAAQVLDGIELLLVELLLGELAGQQVVDEAAVAGVGGDAAGAGMGLGDVALFLERGKLVADRGGADAEPIMLHQGAAPDGKDVRDILLDKGGEHALPAIGEHKHPFPLCSAVECNTQF